LVWPCVEAEAAFIGIAAKPTAPTVVIRRIKVFLKCVETEAISKSP
jgi:hypothetical protein